MTRFARGGTYRKYLSAGNLGFANLSKSEWTVRSGTASLTEQTQNSNDLTPSARTKLYGLSDHVVGISVTNDASSPLRRDIQLLSQDANNYAIQLSLPEFPFAHGEAPGQNSSHHIHSKIEDKQKITEENHDAASPKADNLTLQDVAIFSTQGCTKYDSDRSFGEKLMTQEQIARYLANTGVGNSSHSKPLHSSRPKSCSDLTLSTGQTFQTLTPTARSSSPLLTAGDIPV
jgi:hypothetical protein